MFDIALFSAGVAGGLVISHFWASTIRPWITGEINLVIRGGKADIQRAIDALKAKL